MEDSLNNTLKTLPGNGNGTGIATSGDITAIIQWVIGLGGLIAVAFIVLGGIQYATSSGDPAKAQKAKSTIMYSIIGLVIVVLSEIIVAFIASKV